MKRLALAIAAAAWAMSSAWAAPQRVVALAPSLGELAADLSVGKLERIVGVSEYTDYPPALKKVASIGPYAKVNLERVLSLKPDLVLATTDGNSRDQIDHLRELGLTVVVVSTANFPEVAASIRAVGHALGADTDAEAMARQFEESIARFRARAAGRKVHRRVLLQVGDSPLVVAGKQSFLNEAIEAIGAENVYGDLAAGYPHPSTEDVLARDPEVIVVLDMSGEHEHFLRVAQAWREFKGLRAVRENRVGVIVGDTLVRPTLRLLEGLSKLEKAVYAN